MPKESKYNTGEKLLKICRDFKYNLIPDEQVPARKKCFKWTRRIGLWTLKLSLVIFSIIFIVGPFVFKYLYTVQRSLVFLNFVNWPRNPNYNDPAEYGVDRARNFYVTTDDGVRLGVWHILPDSYKSNQTEYTEDFFNKSLNDGQNVIIYNHGNSGHRIVPFRVELYNLLRKQYHVICWDYRGYGDSTDLEPTETGLVQDAIFIYKWVLNQTNSNVFIWGHSLGTGVSTHMLADLSRDRSRKPSGLILESPFTSFTDEISEHPFAKIFRPLPWFHYTIVDPMLKNGFVFASDKHIIKVDCPILILHAKDDVIVPFILGEKLYKVAVDYRRDFQGNVTFISFEKKFQYGHKFICRAPELCDIVRKFVSQSIKEVEDKNLY